MIGPLTIGRKAAKYGYKRYGVPGAVLAGAGGVGGYVFLKRKFPDTGSSEETTDETNDGSETENATEEGDDERSGNEPE